MLAFYSRWAPLAIMAMAWLGAMPKAASPALRTDRHPTEQADSSLRELCLAYERELPRLGDSDTKPTLASWEDRFKKALANHKGSSALRMRAMDVLADTQSGLGKEDDAFIIYEEMDALAKQDGTLECRLRVGRKQLALLVRRPLGDVTRTVDRVEDSAEALLHEHDNTRERNLYSDALHDIGVVLASRAIAEGDVSDSTRLLKRAKNALEKSVALADSGTTPLATRLYSLAQTQSQLGLRAEAGTSYGQIAGMEDTGFSRLRMEYLRICETMKRDSPQYRAAIERVLAERGGADTYELTLRRLLGQSYRSAEEYAKSTEILTAVSEQGDDPDAKAHDTLLLAKNARDSNDVSTASRFLKEAVVRYPHTGAGQTALAELQKPKYRRSLESEQTRVGSWRIVILGTNLIAIVALLMFLVRRQMKMETS